MYATRWTIGLVCWAVVGLPCASHAAEPEQSKTMTSVELHEFLTRARGYVERGQFAEAEALLRSRLADPAAPAVDPIAVELEVIRRLRHDYALSPQQMLERIRALIPDATAEDVTRWRHAGLLEFRFIDGEVRFFRREATNLLRFSEEARRRYTADREAKGAPVNLPGGWKFGLVDHLAKVVEAGERSETPEVMPVQHKVRYTLTVKPGHPRIHPGAVVRCWLPFPQVYRQQQDVRLLAASPGEPVIAPEGSPQRTAYFERRIEKADEPVSFQVEFAFTTRAYYPKLDPAKATAYDVDSEHYGEFTAPRLPHIALTPEVRHLAGQITAGERNPLLRARRLYLWVCENIRYCAEREYGTMPSIALKALETRRGDCGVQGMLFITLCRAAGIPARWQSGWETLPQDWNMHDWAEFYVEPWGWLPADPSYGLMNSDDPRIREFYFGHLDAYRLIVNLDYARELSPPKTSLRSEPNDFQRGEVEIDGHNLYFDEWDWKFEFETKP